MIGFLSIERLSLGPWQAFERALQRLMVHDGANDVVLVGGSGDHGGDVVANVGGKTVVIQAKFRSNGVLLSAAPIQEVAVAAGHYDAQVAVVATNTGFRHEAISLARRYREDLGIKFILWNKDSLLDRFRRLPQYASMRNDPRPYQETAIDAINSKVRSGADRALLLMATGLGKTRVAAGVIEQWLHEHPTSEILVLSPSLALVPQLEAALWPYLSKHVTTHALTGTEKPSFEGGITFATEQSVLNAVDTMRGRFGLVVVDEAHHAPADGYHQLLGNLTPNFLLGMTATPWRGDRRHLGHIFGPPTATVSIVAGMQMGYLAKVDYRMMPDDIDWNWVKNELEGAISVKELNRRLFIPERDDAMILKIRDHLEEIHNPRTLIFCRSVVHAETISNHLRAEGFVAKAIHSHLERTEVARTLREFRNGDIPTLVAIDMVNEGIDIPDVNLVVFMRVTHSRRIFLQQLGRGLRLSEGKDTVRVLDFVSDIRRIAEALRMNRDARSVASELGKEHVIYQAGDVVQFDNDASLNFFQEYLADVADLEEGTDESRLEFPERH